MNKKLSSALKFILSLALAILLLWFAFRGIDWREFIDGVKATRWGYIVLSMVAALTALVFRSERWRQQLVPLDDSISHSSVWHGSNIGNFLSIVIPGVGEFYRCAHVSTKKASYEKTFGTIMMERSWDILAVLVLIGVAIAGSRGVIVPFLKDRILLPFAERFHFSIWWALAGGLLILAALLFLVFAFRDKNKVCAKTAGILEGVLKGFTTFSKINRKWLFLTYTAGIWVMYIFMTYFTFLAIPGLDHLGFVDAVFISAVGNIASVVPTPGNLGAYHYIVGLAISTIYLASPEITPLALLCATLSHGSHAILLIALGIFSYAITTLNRSGRKNL